MIVESGTQLCKLCEPQWNGRLCGWTLENFKLSPKSVFTMCFKYIGPWGRLRTKTVPERFTHQPVDRGNGMSTLVPSLGLLEHPLAPTLAVDSWRFLKKLCLMNSIHPAIEAKDFLPPASAGVVSKYNGWIQDRKAKSAALQWGNPMVPLMIQQSRV